MDGRNFGCVVLMCSVCMTGCGLANDPDGLERPSPDATLEGDMQAQREPLGFGSCERANQCASRPNAASICLLNDCALDCMSGFADCDRDPSTGCEQSTRTTSHCGGCDQPCEPPKALGSCVNGSCEIAACTLGYGDCDQDMVNGCETLIVTPSHCGECFVECAPANAIARCDGGVCGFSECQEGYADCDGLLDNGCETDITTPLHCGGCDASCQPGQACSSQRCTPSVEWLSSNPFLVTHVVITADHDIILSGRATGDFSLDELTYAADGAHDGVIWRVDMSGEHRGVVLLSGAGDERITGLALDLQGNVWAGGQAEQASSLASLTLTHTGSTDVVLSRLGDELTPLWVLAMGGVGSDSVTALGARSSGGALMGGRFEPPGAFGAGALTAGPSAQYIAEFAPDGSTEWSRAFWASDAGGLALVDLAEDLDGRAMALFSTTGPVMHSTGSISTVGPGLAIIFDSSGDIIQTVSFDDAPVAWSVDFAEPLVALERANGSQYIVSMTTPSSTTLEVPGEVIQLHADPMSEDFYLMVATSKESAQMALSRHTKDGLAQWSYAFEGTPDASAFAIGADGRVIIAASQVHALTQ